MTERSGTAERRHLNDVLRRIARLLVPFNYARGERFDHDPALKFGAVLRLESALDLRAAPADRKPFLKVGLVREINKSRAMLRAVRRELSVSAPVERAAPAPLSRWSCDAGALSNPW